MSTTDQFEKANETTASRRRRMEQRQTPRASENGKERHVSSEKPLVNPLTRSNGNDSNRQTESSDRATRQTGSNHQGQAESPKRTRQTDPTHQSEFPTAKERQRRRSASAETEMTGTMKLSRRKQRKMQKIEKRKNKKPRLRIFPIWLRILVITGLSFAALSVGLMIGYGVLGDGTPKDALKWETWQHIIDIIYKEE